eukprot:TRINITY_DN2419_c0_g1_i1.p1 TRINITY_DN2419_c0_g1~~TRINITY_DN2419_c0_g1_i1.p1  ORF type:complete len:760 (+),score=168.01 TRINITY_DN2419_c0_g1_i1:111-2390(+)
MTTMRTSTLGFPRIGQKREMKVALEKYWAGKITAGELKNKSNEVARNSFREQARAGVDLIGVGDHTLYDHILDWGERFGLTCRRVREAGLEGLDSYFTQARGKDGIPALDMTKYFDSNYHYMVPEVDGDTRPTAHFDSFLELVRLAHEEARATAKGKDQVVPIVTGPITLSMLCDHKEKSSGASALAKQLTPLYATLLQELGKLGVKEVQFHEPWLVYREAEEAEMHSLVREIYEVLGREGPGINLCVHFDSVSRVVYRYLVALPVKRVTLDFCRNEEMVKILEAEGFPETKELGAGVVDGRNVWRCEGPVRGLLQRIKNVVRDCDRLVVSPSCSLMFLPYDLGLEGDNISKAMRSKLAFAMQKLEVLALVATDTQTAAADSTWIGEDNLTGAVVEEDMLKRAQPYAVRRKKQVGLPPFPTTTIGSFPQTPEIRRARKGWKEGQITDEEYSNEMQREVRRVVNVQKEIGLDVFVHGEAERSDMVEYFAEKLDGMLVTRRGWVQSYGSRYVRPPVIYGKVKRKEGVAMTVKEFEMCQQESGETPVKGMLTGPVTIVNWSFCRVGVPRAQQAAEVALAVREEVADLERAGCRILQVDEAALRERMPLKGEEGPQYLEWAVACFRLATCGADPKTMIVTHMCYSAFGDIISKIDEMDADVLTIENSRSDGEMVAALAAYGYKRDLGPGVYDIHSPVVPTKVKMAERGAAAFRACGLPPASMWINPDCGLKTRKWEEVIPSLKNMVAAAQHLRHYHGLSQSHL